jgi:hypothetical protein
VSQVGEELLIMKVPAAKLKSFPFWPGLDFRILGAEQKHWR